MTAAALTPLFVTPLFQADLDRLAGSCNSTETATHAMVRSLDLLAGTGSQLSAADWRAHYGVEKRKGLEPYGDGSREIRHPCKSRSGECRGRFA